jgi:hypothetical protein
MVSGKLFHLPTAYLPNAQFFIRQCHGAVDLRLQGFGS